VIPRFSATLPHSILLSTALLLGACESAIGPQPLPGGVEVRTTSSVIPVDTSGTIKRATISGKVMNKSARTLVLGYCGHTIAKLVGNEWVDVWTQSCAAIDGVDVEVLPGDSAAFGVQVANVTSGGSGVFDFGSPNTQFRLRVRMLLKEPVPFGDEVFEIEADDRLSNSFSFAN